MSDMVLYIAAVLAFFFVVSCFARSLESRSDRREQYIEQPFIALGSPSATNAFDRRIDAAVREASRGFRLCDRCHFTNRARSESCAACGHRLGGTTGKAAVASESVDPVPLTRRQLRARNRKDWVRRLDEKDRVVWHRIQKPMYIDGVVSPSYVIHAALSDPLQRLSLNVNGDASDGPPLTTTDTTLDTHGSVIIDIDVVSTTSPMVTFDGVSALLRDEIASVKLAASEVVDGQPVRNETSLSHHLSPPSTSNQDVKDSVMSSQVDFPTKLAEFIMGTSTAFLQATSNEDGTTKCTRLAVHRKTLLSDSIESLATMTPTQARAAVRVDFADEQGIDAGGVYREWFHLFNEQIVSSEAGVFTCVDREDQVFYLNPHSRELLGEDHLNHFLATGRLLGRALLEGNVTGFHLALPLLKIILGLPVGFDDLEYFDPDVYKNLKWLLENDGADALCLNFTVVKKLPNGTTRVVELVPGGSEMDVNDANKRDFVDRKLKYLLFESVSSQLFAFLKGLYEVVPAELLMLFDAEELDYVLSGSDEIDVDDWERNSQTSLNLRSHPALKNFWKVVRELDLADRRRLLQFATGSTRVPPGGFSALTSFDGRQCAFTLHGFAVRRLRGYIGSHACFNRLDLPLHCDLKTMRQAIEAAIAVDSFGFTSS